MKAQSVRSTDIIEIGRSANTWIKKNTAVKVEVLNQFYSSISKQVKCTESKEVKSSSMKDNSTKGNYT